MYFAAPISSFALLESFLKLSTSKLAFLRAYIAWSERFDICAKVLAAIVTAYLADVRALCDYCTFWFPKLESLKVLLYFYYASCFKENVILAEDFWSL